MTIIVSRHGIHGDLAGYIGRLEALLAHLKGLAEERLPTGEELAVAPVIDRYQRTLRPARCLIGAAAPKAWRTTSALCVYAPDFGWTWTFGGLHRLGRPLDASESEDCGRPS